MVVEALTAAAVLYGLVVKPAGKWLLVNHAMTPRDARRTVVLQDGRKVKVVAAVVENSEGAEEIKCEVWDDGKGGRMLTAAEVELLNEGRALRDEVGEGVPMVESDRVRIMELIDRLRREILVSRARAIK